MPPQLQIKLTKKVTRAQRLKARVRAVRPMLVQFGWPNVKSILLKYYPEYNNFDDAITVLNVWNCQGSDQKLTEILEDIANGKLRLS
jgi:hypothetical protein